MIPADRRIQLRQREQHIRRGAGPGHLRGRTPGRRGRRTQRPGRPHVVLARDHDHQLPALHADRAGPRLPHPQQPRRRSPRAQVRQHHLLTLPHARQRRRHHGQGRHRRIIHSHHRQRRRLPAPPRQRIPQMRRDPLHIRTPRPRQPAAPRPPAQPPHRTHTQPDRHTQRMRHIITAPQPVRYQRPHHHQPQTHRQTRNQAPDDVEGGVLDSRRRHQGGRVENLAALHQLRGAQPDIYLVAGDRLLKGLQLGLRLGAPGAKRGQPGLPRRRGRLSAELVDLPAQRADLLSSLGDLRLQRRDLLVLLRLQLLGPDRQERAGHGPRPGHRGGA